MTERAREDVEGLLGEVRPLLEIAGIPEQQLNVALGKNFKVKHFVAAFDWLHQFTLSPQMDKFRAAYELRPPEVWAMYEAMGTEGLREQDILQDAAKEVQKRWRVGRPRIFGKDRPNAEDDGSQQEDNQECTE